MSKSLHTYNHSRISFQEKNKKFFRSPRPCVASPYLLANVRLLPPSLFPCSILRPASGGTTEDGHQKRGILRDDQYFPPPRWERFTRLRRINLSPTQFGDRVRLMRRIGRLKGGVRGENFVDIMIKIHNKIQNIKSCRPRRKSEDKLPFMVRYLTTNGK